MSVLVYYSVHEYSMYRHISLLMHITSFKKSVNKISKKGLKQVVASNTMHFYILISLSCVTEQHSTFSLTNSVIIPFRYLFWVGSPWELMICISKLSRDVEVDWIWCHIVSVLFNNPTYKFSLNNFFITCLLSFLHNQGIIFPCILVIIFLCIFQYLQNVCNYIALAAFVKQ